jgi:hypothetical protein
MVWITFHWNGPNSWIRVDDDGAGMTEEQLVEAMRPGSRSPIDERDSGDLGRFGLGLKSASFSQCRLVTVRTRAESQEVATRVWDLDYVVATREWRLLQQADQESESRLAADVTKSHGTSILWGRLDRVVDESPTADAAAMDRFLMLQERTERHLAMTFHRFLEPPTSLRIHINGHLVEAWDPFLRTEASTQQLQVETLRLGGTPIPVQPFVLPHFSKLSTLAHQRAAGPGGWNAQQGFYVYRNRRLLVAGSWLGLGLQKEEHYKLARIRIDLPNTLDQLWQIDVRKASATPPGPNRVDLRRIATVTRSRAADVYRFRGKRAARAAAADFVFVWETIRTRDKTHYRINRKHPLVQGVVSGEVHSRADIRAMLQLIEETIPQPVIAIEHAENETSQAAPFETSSIASVRAVLDAVYRALRVQGLDASTARLRLEAMEPFAQFPELAARLDALELEQSA